MLKRIVIMGECLVELFQLVENVYSHNFSSDVFTTAVYLKRASESPVDVQFFTAIGSDLISDKLLNTAKSEKIDISLMLRTKLVQPGIYMNNIDAFGGHSFKYWRGFSGVKQLLDSLNDQLSYTTLKGCDMFFFSSISLANLSDTERSQFFKLIKRLKADGSQIVFTPNYRSLLWSNTESAKKAIVQAYKLADVALSELEDHRKLFNAQTTNDVVRHLNDLGVSEIIVKNGNNCIKGRYLKQEFTDTGLTVKKEIDNRAASDSFNGGYLAARIGGLTPMDAIKFAKVLTGFVLENTGPIVNREQFSKFLAQNLPSSFVH